MYSVSFTHTDPSWLHVASEFASGVLVYQLKFKIMEPATAIASGASQFAFMLHIGSIQLWQAHLSFRSLSIFLQLPLTHLFSALYAHHR